MNKDVPSYVSMAFDTRVDVVASNKEDIAVLRSMGFELSGTAFSLVVYSDLEKARVFMTLRDYSIALLTGKEWSPSDIFQLLAEQRLIEGPYLEIAWSDPSEWILSQKAAPEK